MRQVALTMATERSIPNSVPARMAALARAPENERMAAERLIQANVRSFPSRRDMVREGEPARAAFVILNGWACLYKSLPDGRRQIITFLLPGDVWDISILSLPVMDHSVAAITALEAAQLGTMELERMIQLPGVGRALLRQSLVLASIQREWTLNVGQRSAYERLASLMCEMFCRLRAAGLADGDGCPFPLTQTDLADACGLTPVHVNRMIQQLRGEGLIRLNGKRLIVPDLERLADAAAFDPDYLHLEPVEEPRR